MKKIFILMIFLMLLTTACVSNKNESFKSKYFDYAISEFIKTLDGENIDNNKIKIEEAYLNKMSNYAIEFANDYVNEFKDQLLDWLTYYYENLANFEAICILFTQTINKQKNYYSYIYNSAQEKSYFDYENLSYSYYYAKKRVELEPITNWFDVTEDNFEFCQKHRYIGKPAYNVITISKSKVIKAMK